MSTKNNCEWTAPGTPSRVLFRGQNCVSGAPHAEVNRMCSPTDANGTQTCYEMLADAMRFSLSLSLSLERASLILSYWILILCGISSNVLQMMWLKRTWCTHNLFAMASTHRSGANKMHEHTDPRFHRPNTASSSGGPNTDPRFHRPNTTSSSGGPNTTGGAHWAHNSARMLANEVIRPPPLAQQAQQLPLRPVQQAQQLPLRPVQSKAAPQGFRPHPMAVAQFCPPSRQAPPPPVAVPEGRMIMIYMIRRYFRCLVVAQERVISRERLAKAVCRWHRLVQTKVLIKELFWADIWHKKCLLHTVQNPLYRFIRRA